MSSKYDKQALAQTKNSQPSKAYQNQSQMKSLLQSKIYHSKSFDGRPSLAINPVKLHVPIQSFPIQFQISENRRKPQKIKRKGYAAKVKNMTLVFKGKQVKKGGCSERIGVAKEGKRKIDIQLGVWGAGRDTEEITEFSIKEYQ